MTESEWLASEDPEAMLRWLSWSHQSRNPLPRASDRKLRLFVVALALEYHKEWFSDALAAHLWIDGLAAPPAPSPSRWNLYDLPARGAATEAVRNLTKAVVRPTKWVTPAGIREARRRVRRDRAAALLRDLLGNPWKPVELPPGEKCKGCRGEGSVFGGAGGASLAREPRIKCRRCQGRGFTSHPWLTPNVLAVATAAYDDRTPGGTLDPARLAVLSDALEEAGCDDGLLAALRSPGPHYRGFWALDLVLGKS